MRFQSSFPVDLAREIGRATGVELEPRLRKLLHEPTEPRVQVTLERLRRTVCDPFILGLMEVPTDAGSVIAVAESLVGLAAAMPHDDCASTLLVDRAAHFRWCPSCSKRLAVVYTVAVEDLKSSDQSSLRDLRSCYRRASDTLLPFLLVDCDGSSLPFYAETAGQDAIAERAVGRLWRIPEFVADLNSILLSERARVGKRIDDERFEEIVAEFVTSRTTLRFVGRFVGRA